MDPTLLQPCVIIFQGVKLLSPSEERELRVYRGAFGGETGVFGNYTGVLVVEFIVENRDMA